MSNLKKSSDRQKERKIKKDNEKKLKEKQEEQQKTDGGDKSRLQEILSGGPGHLARGSGLGFGGIGEIDFLGGGENEVVGGGIAEEKEEAIARDTINKRINHMMDTWLDIIDEISTISEKDTKNEGNDVSRTTGIDFRPYGGLSAETGKNSLPSKGLYVEEVVSNEGN